MILKTFLKQPEEFKDYDIDYSPWLTPMGDTLDEVDVSIDCLDDPSDTSLEFTYGEITPSMFKIWIRGGTSGYAYKVTLRAYTVRGRIDESELIFAVGDI